MHVTIGTQGPQGAGTKMTSAALQTYPPAPEQFKAKAKANPKAKPDRIETEPEPNHYPIEFPLPQTKPGPAFESRIDTRGLVSLRHSRLGLAHPCAVFIHLNVR